MVKKTQKNNKSKSKKKTGGKKDRALVVRVGGLPHHPRPHHPRPPFRRRPPPRTTVVCNIM